MNKSFKLTAVAILALVILGFSFRPHRIAGDCMEPAIVDGNLYFVNQLSPYFKKPKASDIVVISYEKKPWISRVIALENDTVYLRNGSVLVNGVVLEENKVNRNWSNWDYGTFGIEKPFKVPKNHVFVLSDNLDSKHDDSRVFGPIHNSLISGHVW